MLMSRRLPESNPHRSSSIKRRLFQNEEEDSEDPDDEDPAERLRRIQMNRESVTENFFNRQAEQLDGISRDRWNFDFRNETPINNNRAQWEWDMQVVKLSETNVPKLYLNVLGHNDDEPLESGPSSRNCPTCSKHKKVDSKNLSTPTKPTDVNESQMPIKKSLVRANLESLQCSSSKVPKSSSSETQTLSSLPCSVTTAPATKTESVENLADDSCVDIIDEVIQSKQDKVSDLDTSDTAKDYFSNSDTPPE